MGAQVTHYTSQSQQGRDKLAVDSAPHLAALGLTRAAPTMTRHRAAATILTAKGATVRWPARSQMRHQSQRKIAGRKPPETSSGGQRYRSRVRIAKPPGNRSQSADFRASGVQRSAFYQRIASLLAENKSGGGSGESFPNSFEKFSEPPHRIVPQVRWSPSAPSSSASQRPSP